MTFYLHIFIDQLARYDTEGMKDQKRFPTIFNMSEHKAPRILTNILFYWQVPFVLSYFSYKAGPLPLSPVLIGITSLTTAILFHAFTRRNEFSGNPWWRILRVVLLGIAIGLLLIPLGARTLTLNKANLEGKSLSRMKLVRAKMHEINLKNADLYFTNFFEAELPKADLSGANLSEAILFGADLRWANLTDADLRGASLQNADLSGADLRGADLTDANLRGVNLRKTNLSGVKGLTAEQLGSALYYDSTIPPQYLIEQIEGEKKK